MRSTFFSFHLRREYASYDQFLTFYGQDLNSDHISMYVEQGWFGICAIGSIWSTNIRVVPSHSASLAPLYPVKNQGLAVRS